MMSSYGLRLKHRFLKTAVRKQCGNSVVVSICWLLLTIKQRWVEWSTRCSTRHSWLVATLIDCCEGKGLDWTAADKNRSSYNKALLLPSLISNVRQSVNLLPRFSPHTKLQATGCWAGSKNKARNLPLYVSTIYTFTNGIAYPWNCTWMLPSEAIDHLITC